MCVQFDWLVQAAEKEAENKRDSRSQAVWRKRLHSYMDHLFSKDSSAGAAFHGLQVTPI